LRTLHEVVADAQSVERWRRRGQRGTDGPGTREVAHTDDVEGVEAMGLAVDVRSGPAAFLAEADRARLMP
jgi:hypothetical protein